MVMCTKALLDVNPEPTDDEIRYALRNNYCRCTGYVKIMDAVRLAAKILKKGFYQMMEILAGLLVPVFLV